MIAGETGIKCTSQTAGVTLTGVRSTRSSPHWPIPPPVSLGGGGGTVLLLHLMERCGRYRNLQSITSGAHLHAGLIEDNETTKTTWHIHKKEASAARLHKLRTAAFIKQVVQKPANCFPSNVYLKALVDGCCWILGVGHDMGLAYGSLQCWGLTPVCGF